MIVFRAQGRHVRFVLPMPTEAELKTMRSKDAKEREIRRRWRALNLCIKAKLEAVATNIETFEESFMAHVVLPDGRTMAEAALPQIGQAYKDGPTKPSVQQLICAIGGDVDTALTLWRVYNVKLAQRCVNLLPGSKAAYGLLRDARCGNIPLCSWLPFPTSEKQP